jgi:uncharacterized cupredoxin-like copper-binding protein
MKFVLELIPKQPWTFILRLRARVPLLRTNGFLRRLLVIAAASMVPVGAAYAHGPATKASGERKAISTEEKPFGREGDPKKINRTVRIDMSDTMRFNPAQLTVKQGDTIRFEVKNSGKMMHELVLGTMKDLQEHAELMRKHPGMEHDEPYMAHVAPGKTERIVWQFTKPGEFNYGCLVAGHFEAGMIGKLIVR